MNASITQRLLTVDQRPFAKRSKCALHGDVAHGVLREVFEIIKAESVERTPQSRHVRVHKAGAHESNVMSALTVRPPVYLDCSCIVVVEAYSFIRGPGGR